MGYDNPQRESGGSAVAIVTVIVAVLLGGLVLLGVGALFFVRTVRMEAREVEMVARVEADRTVVEMEKAARVQIKKSAKVELPEASARELIIEIDQDGAIKVDDERTDLDDLKAQLQKAGENGNVRLAVQMKVDPLCLARHVLAVQSICSELGVQNVQMSPLDTPSSATAGEDASTTEAAEPQ